MTRHRLLHWLVSRICRTHQGVGSPVRARLTRARPLLEALEDRSLLSAGALDYSFNGTGMQVVPFDQGAHMGGDVAYAVAVQPDGKVVVAGDMNTRRYTRNAWGQVVPAPRDFYGVVRLNPDGSLDPTFDGDGKLTLDIGSAARAIAIQPDGKIVLAGVSGGRDSEAGNFTLARLNPNGSLDTTFDSDGVATVAFGAPGQTQNSAAYAMTLQPDGKIVVAGYVVIGSGNTDFGFARLNPDGSLDTTFGINNNGKQVIPFDLGSDLVDKATGVVVQPDGRIVGVGSAGVEKNFAAVRLTTNGLPDGAFGTNGKSVVYFAGPSAATGVALQSDGRLVLGGYAALTFANDFAAVRLNPDGSPDGSFGTSARVTIPFTPDSGDMARGVAVQPDGKIVLGGVTKPNPIEHVLAASYAAARLNSDGSLDTTFNGSGTQTIAVQPEASAYALAIQPDGDILLAGNGMPDMYREGFGVVRLLGDPLMLVAPDVGGPPIVRVLRSNGMAHQQLEAYGSAFTGGVRIASADVTGDRYPDILTAPGPGGQPYVNVFDGRTLQRLRQIQVYGLAFTGGVNLAVANVLGPSDGPAEIVVAPDMGGEPYVNVLDSQTGELLRSFLVYGPSFTGGVRVATGDLEATGVARILVAPQAGGAPYVNVFDADTRTLVRQYQVFGEEFTGGLFVAADHLKPLPGADLVVGPDAGGGPYVNLIDATTGGRLRQFQAYTDAFSGGVRVGAADYTADGYADVIVGPGAGGSPRVRILDGLTGAQLAAFDAFDPSVTGGLFVVGVER